NRQFSLVLGCLQASFHPFSPHIASAECKKGKVCSSQRPLLGLVAASVLLGQNDFSVSNVALVGPDSRRNHYSFRGTSVDYSLLAYGTNGPLRIPRLLDEGIGSRLYPSKPGGKRSLLCTCANCQLGHRLG